MFVPAFPECGRVTRGGVHYLVTAEEHIPVASTEFAKDTTFGYSSERLDDWVKEISDGWTAELIPHERLTSIITKTLLEAKPGTVVIPDASCDEDLRLIATGLQQAEAAGKEIVIRSASSFAAVRCGLKPLALTTGGLKTEGRLLLVCGSHTAASTKQLRYLLEQTGVQPIILLTKELLQDNSREFTFKIADLVRENLLKSQFAVLITERHIQQEHGNLQSGSLIMKALTDVVRDVSAVCDGIITKGGITSAQVAVLGFEAESATVKGQLEAGISLWQLHTADGRELPYCVVPGNVGEEQTLVKLIAKLKPTLLPR